MKLPGLAKILFLSGSLAIVHGCGTILQPVATEGSIMYTRGARQHTAMVQVHLPPAEVYKGMLRIVADDQRLKVINKNASRYLVEVEEDGRFVSAQATELSDGQTLLFIWADAGKSGQSGRELTRAAAESICKELAVKCVEKSN